MYNGWKYSISRKPISLVKGLSSPYPPSLYYSVLLTYAPYTDQPSLTRTPESMPEVSQLLYIVLTKPLTLVPTSGGEGGARGVLLRGVCREAGDFLVNGGGEGKRPLRYRKVYVIQG